MLNNIKNFIKTDFNIRYVIYYLAFISALIIPISIDPAIKQLWFIIFFISAEIVVVIIATRVTDVLKLRFKYKVESMPIPDEIANLAKNMGVNIHKFLIAHGLKNAYATPWGNVVIGSEIIKAFPRDEILAILAHEFAHIKKRHSLFRLLIMIPVIIYGIGIYRNLPPVMANIAILAYSTVLMMPVHWYFELQADKLAAEFARGDNMKAALIRLTERSNPNEPSEDHPSITNRIRFLDRNKIEKRALSHPCKNHK